MLKNKNEEQTLVDRYHQSLKNNQVCSFTLSEYHTLAGYFIEKYRYREALEVCEISVRQYPFSFEALLLLSEALSYLEAYDEALEAIEKAETIQPNEPDVLKEKGRLFALWGRDDDALRVLEAFEQRSENWGQPSDLLHDTLFVAEICQGIGQFNRAVDHYHKALPLFDDILHFDEFSVDLIEAYQNVGRVDELVDLLENLLRETPFSALRCYQLAVVYFWTRETTLAIAVLECALDADKDICEIWFQKANAHVLAEEYAPALACYAQAAKLTEMGKPHIYCCMGETYRKNKDPEKAKLYFYKALEQDQNFGRAWFYLGISAYEEDDVSKSEEYFKEALKHPPEMSDYWVYLARAQYELDKKEQAEYAFCRAAELEEDNPVLWLEWSAVHYLEDDLERSIEIIEEGISRLPLNAHLIYRLTVYHMIEGNMQEAVKNLNIALLISREGLDELYAFFKNNEKMQELISVIVEYCTKEN